MKLFLTFSFLLLNFAFAKINVVVSILPQKTFVEKIGGDKINLTLMVQPGNSPHTYEPKPSQMREIAKADLYLAIDVEFEETWLPKFQALNPSMKIVDLDEGIVKLAIEKHNHEEEKKHQHHDENHAHEKDTDATHQHNHEGLDPHIWTSPANVKIIAKNILTALQDADAKNSSYYENNYNKFLQEIEKTKHTIITLLKDRKSDKFMVFHPAWGYFAHQFGLKQMAIEAGGKNPKPKQIAYLIAEAKEEKVSAIFTAPEFSEKVARQIALEVNVPVVKISPLNPKWSENLINLAKAIANK